MNNSVKSLCIIFHDIHGICGSFPAVDNYWFLYFSRELQLADKPLLLYLMRFIIPIIIQTDLSDCNHFFVTAEFFHVLDLIFVKFSNLIRMHTDCSINMWILSGKCQNLLTGFISRTYIHDCSNFKIRHRF